ncbi:unnamed protein product [Pleuronectes platessa]|uniref:Uncharacterized protein n=1 Tax=Pleuronectes platessa TaxID=8262 RepID=A0A9N7TMP2_PLEPL|nr:unnamed protein product [Pleuronectes platessa]
MAHREGAKQSEEWSYAHVGPTSTKLACCCTRGTAETEWLVQEVLDCFLVVTDTMAAHRSCQDGGGLEQVASQSPVHPRPAGSRAVCEDRACCQAPHLLLCLRLHFPGVIPPPPTGTILQQDVVRDPDTPDGTDELEEE